MTVSVKIAGRKYFATIDSQDEELLRRAVKRLNDKYKELIATLDVSTFDHLALAALLISIDNEENKERQKYSTDRQELDELTQAVKRALSSNN